MRWSNGCIYCQHGDLYALKDGMVKCSRCRRKYSPRRIDKIVTLMGSFAHDETARQASRHLGLSYPSVHKHFDTFRRHAARICEDEYEMLRHTRCEFEEYFYLEHSKRHRKESVFDAHNFLTFDHGGHIYTLVMPTLHRFRQRFTDENHEAVYSNAFASFKRKTHIINVTKHVNNIVAFWDYFERSITRYKGVSLENFPLYLKEIEFKFNHDTVHQMKLLQDYYFRDR